MSADQAPARKWFELITETVAVKGWSIAELSARSGIARSTIYGWRDNQGKPQAKAVNPVADALGIDRARALRLAGVIPAVATPKTEAPTPEEIEDIRANMRETLGPKAAPVLRAFDAALAETAERDIREPGGREQSGAPPEQYPSRAS